MNILITSAGSELARNVAEALAEAHTLRLTELQPVENIVGTFVQSDLGHDEATNELVRGIDTIIHIAEVPPQLLAEADQPDIMLSTIRRAAPIIYSWQHQRKA